MHGVAATLTGQLARTVLQLIGFAVLSRILSPQDFGIVAIVMGVVGLAAILTDFGLSLAAIQAPSLSKQEKNALFWANVEVGLLATLILAVCAYPIQLFYDVHDLAYIVLALSLSFLVTSLTVQFRVELTRLRRFTKLALYDTLAQAISLIFGIAAALFGAGAWSLVIQQIVFPAALMAFFLTNSTWRPGVPMLCPPIRRFATFGAGTVVTQVINYASVSLPSIVLGRSVGVEAAGQYTRAYQLFVAPMSQIASPLTRVVLAYLAPMWRTDLFRERILQAQQMALLLIGSIMSLLALDGASVTRVLLGVGWEPAGTALQILAIGGIFQSLTYVNYWGMLASGRIRTLFKVEIPGRTVMIVGAVVAAPFGIGAVSWVMTAGVALIALLGLSLGLPSLGIDIRSSLTSIAVPIVYILTSVSICLILNISLNQEHGLPDWTKILVDSSVFASLAMLVCIIPVIRRRLTCYQPVLRILREKRIFT